MHELVFDFTELLLTAKEKALAKTIVQYWSSFADTGTPQAAGAVAWPAYDAATDQNVQLDVVPALGFGLKKSVCDFWDSVPRNATAHF